MDNMHDDFWNDVLPDIREALGLKDLSIEESKKAYDEAPAVDLHDNEIEWLMKCAMTEIPQEPGCDVGSHEIPKATLEGFLQLNREEGEEDPEIDALIRRQRDEALDEDGNDEADKPELD